MDPHSFAYNQVTPDESYLNATSIVRTLVDITAKNGNFLLDIGPKEDGTIPEIMQSGLKETGKETGKWLKEHSEGIYDTKYWPFNQGQGDFRYVITENAFYIHVLSKPPMVVTLPNKVPYLRGDQVVVIGGKMNGQLVPAKLNNEGLLVLSLSQDIIEGDKYVWTFKILF